MYITAASTISHQPSFRNGGFSSSISPLCIDSAILHPDYGTFISAKDSRRLNDVLKMAIACSADCLTQAGLEQPEAVIVGTSMGCNHFTKTFLDKIIEADNGLISPTAFMLSTHNTIAGQISLFLGNRRHNMTHTQNSLSFEQALIDGMLCVREGCSHVLAGAADEMQNDLYDMHIRLNNRHLHVTCGASFFILAATNTGGSAIKLVDVGSFGLVDNMQETITNFLYTNDLPATGIDLVLYSSGNSETPNALRHIFDPPVLLDYQALSGAYYTNSAFALHYAVDMMRTSRVRNIRRALICNNLIPENLGLILISA